MGGPLIRSKLSAEMYLAVLETMKISSVNGPEAASFYPGRGIVEGLAEHQLLFT